MTDTLLQITRLNRRYKVGADFVTALNNVSFTIQQGEFVAIMGPSGCGKSTLLNLMGGLDQPSGGQVLLEGFNLAAYKEEELAALRREKIGFIFQRHELFPVLTARENVEFPMLLNGVLPDERRWRAEGLLQTVGLADKADHLPDELSGGQQQRVGIARSLANGPRLLLADEPTGNLDSASAGEVLETLIHWVRQLGLTLIMVTHDPESAARADRILHLKDGYLVPGNDKTP